MVLLTIAHASGIIAAVVFIGLLNCVATFISLIFSQWEQKN
jgi:hypothetical protein